MLLFLPLFLENGHTRRLESGLGSDSWCCRRGIVVGNSASGGGQLAKKARACTG